MRAVAKHRTHPTVESAARAVETPSLFDPLIAPVFPPNDIGQEKQSSQLLELVQLL